jgi:hypothetical protein
MDLGDLIFFVIFIVIVASNIFQQARKNRKSRDTGAAPAKTGWRKALEDMIRDAREQMEPGAGTASSKPGRPPLSWEDLIGPEPEESPFLQTQSEPEPPVLGRPRSVSEAPGREADFDELGAKGAEALAWDWDKAHDAENQSRRLERMRKARQPEAERTTETYLNEDDLENAVIWHEILSPPLGLRSF